MASGTLALLGDLSAVVFSRVHVTLYPTVSVRWWVGQFVGRSVGWSVGWSVTHLFFRRFLGSFRITAPAQSHATDSAVYNTALFLLKET